MLHTIKKPKEDFNLLFLNENEFIINSLVSNFYHVQSNYFEKGILHLTTKGLIFQPNEIFLPVFLFKFKDNLQIKFCTLDDIYSTIQKDNSDLIKQNTYLGKNVLMRQLTKKNTSQFNNLLTDSPKLKNSSKRKSYTSNYTNKRLSEVIKEDSNINQNINWNNFKMGDFCETLNLIVCGNNNKRRESFYNTQFTFMDNKNFMKNNNITNLNQINTNINIKINSLDLNHFFNDNLLNLKQFYELIKFLKEEIKDSNKYNFLLFSIGKYECISRVQIGIYEKEISPVTFFIILEGKKKDIQLFNENRKLINDNLIHKNSFDDLKEIYQFIRRKVNEIYENKNEIIINNNQIQIKAKAIRLLPEGSQHGIFICSKNNKYNSHYIRFYPIINNFKRKNLTIQLNKIEAIIKYRYLYKNLGLNIILYQSKRSKILLFENETECEKIEEYLLKNSPNIDKIYTNLQYHSDLWSKGLILNYDYLLYLNFMSGRSFNDLSQYPVFPWILSNYEGDENFDITNEKNYRDLSKPIGALNPDKLSRFREKYLNNKTNLVQQEDIFLYPIHYSSPLIIMFYLNRQFPRFQLQMQGGSFDNGIMDGIKEFWEYLYSEGNDVMELIPEFFEGDGEFLLNYNNLLYGKKKKNSEENNLKLIPDVILPKWAKSPKEFISINRCALEGNYVSNNLNNWIDLIFGYKQRGEMAEMHENLFRKNTYDDYNLDNISENKKFIEINNILLSGQTPQQLFLCVHPKKKPMDLLNYELQYNPNDALQKFKKENEKLEKDYKKMLQAQCEQNKNMLLEIEGIEKKKNEEIDKIKNTLDYREKKQKEIIEKVIDNNQKLKKDFDFYDQNKDIYVNNYVTRLEKENNEEIKKKFSSVKKIIEYIREMEMEINKYKIREIDYKEEIQQKTKEIEKYTIIQNDLKKHIEKLDSKISLSNKLIKKENKNNNES